MRIVIYVQNSDIEALKPLAKRLTNKGAHVMFSALKFMEVNEKAEQVLTLPKYLDTVKQLFSHLNIPVSVIEDVADEAPVAEVIAAVELTEAEVPVLVIPEAEEAPADVPELINILPVATDEPEVVVMSVSEVPAKPTRSRRPS